jgi:hypothetical protein
MVNVVCIKWGNKYSAEYVNKLAAMVKRNLSIPYRFVCLTEDTKGIAPGIETLPLPDMEIDGLTGWWHKISMFRPTVHDLEGQTLFLDLDVVITGSLDCFFDLPGDFCIIKDWAYKSRRMWNSSVFRLEIGKQTNVYEEFIRKGPDNVMKKLHGDQNFITEVITDATVWPADWCQSYKYHCCVPRDTTPHLPDGAKILIFHGKPDHHEALKGSTGTRYQAAPWLADYWNENPPVTTEPTPEINQPAPVPVVNSVYNQKLIQKVERDIALCRGIMEKPETKADQTRVEYYTNRLAVLQKALDDFNG